MTRLLGAELFWSRALQRNLEKMLWMPLPFVLTPITAGNFGGLNSTSTCQDILRPEAIKGSQIKIKITCNVKQLRLTTDNLAAASS